MRHHDPRDPEQEVAAALPRSMARLHCVIEGKDFLGGNVLRVFACAANCFTVSMYAKFFGRHFRSGDPVRYLLEGDVARIIRTPMIWFFVDAER